MPVFGGVQEVASLANSDMLNSSSTDSHSLSVTGASARAPSVLNRADASKRTFSYDCEILPSATATHVHQHDEDFEASSRPAKLLKSSMGSLSDSMHLPHLLPTS